MFFKAHFNSPAMFAVHLLRIYKNFLFWTAASFFQHKNKKLPSAETSGNECSKADSISGMNVPWNEQSRERMFHGLFDPFALVQ